MARLGKRERALKNEELAARQAAIARRGDVGMGRDGFRSSWERILNGEFAGTPVKHWEWNAKGKFRKGRAVKK